MVSDGRPRSKRGKKGKRLKPQVSNNKSANDAPNHKTRAKRDALSSAVDVDPDSVNELVIDPGTASESWWWCRSLFEGGAKVPADMEQKIQLVYRQEGHMQVLATPDAILLSSV